MIEHTHTHTQTHVHVRVHTHIHQPCVRVEHTHVAHRHTAINYFHVTKVTLMAVMWF